MHLIRKVGLHVFFAFVLSLIGFASLLSIYVSKSIWDTLVRAGLGIGLLFLATYLVCEARHLLRWRDVDLRSQ